MSARADLRVSRRTDPSDAAAWPALRSGQGAARSLRPRRRRPAGITVAMPRCAPGDNAATAMKSVVVDVERLRLGRRRAAAPPARRARSSTRCTCADSRAIRAPASREATRGTYAGLIEKIPYLQQLGITAVELLPVFQFDAQDCPPGRVNYWGYAPVSFFAPASRRTARARTRSARSTNFATWSRPCIAPVSKSFSTWSSTTPPREATTGPTLCFRGWENPTYYILEQDRARYANYSGTRQHAQRESSDRSPLDRGQPPLLGRADARGRLSLRPGVDSLSRRDGTSAEKSAGALGHRVRPGRWRAPSSSPRRGMPPGCIRSAASSATAGRSGTADFATTSAAFSAAKKVSPARVADRMVGSPEIYGHEGREPEQSVNFVTCHDGFTLNDLVSYNHKHNEANGERQSRRRERQPQLELRRRRSDRRSRRGAAAQPAGEELLRGDAAVAGHADDPDG